VILFPRARRRHPGVYWYRTRRHLKRGTEWGYVGKSNHLILRADCHEGRCTRHPACAGGKPWSDLIVRRGQLELPWWLGWQWITLSLETAVIFALRPRYNWQKNPRRSKVPPRIQVMQRAARDRAIAPDWASIYLRRSYLDLAVRAAGVLIILTSLTGWWLNR
jgi:hypothetical protein